MAETSRALISRLLRQLYSVQPAFSKRFYDKFFAELPRARRLFPPDPKRQELVLYATMTVLVRALENQEDLDRELIEFGRQHARIGVEEHFFGIFGNIFLDTMLEFLPELHDHTLVSAWHEAFEDISSIVMVGCAVEQSKRELDGKLFARRVDPRPTSAFAKATD